MGQKEVPFLYERFQCCIEVFWRSEGFAQNLASHDPKPVLDPVEPEPMVGGEVDDDPLVLSAQPLHSLRLGVQIAFGWARDSAEFGHHLAEGIAAMGR